MRMSPLALLSLACGASSAWGGSVQGPSVAAQTGAAAQIQPAVGSRQETEVQRTRYEADLLAPIPLPGNNTLVLTSELAQEDRVYTGAGAASVPDAFRHPNVAGFDALILSDAATSGPQVFAGAGRYGHLGLGHDAKPMWEAVAGVSINRAAVPATLIPSAGDEVTILALVRKRTYPGFDKWLFLAGYDLKRASGWFTEVEVPSHVVVGWEAASMAWRAEAGVRWSSQEFPVADGGTAGWLDGYTTTYLLRLRRQLTPPFYLAGEVGMESELLRFADERGVTLESHQTRYAPWARIALETWVQTP